MIGHGKYKTGGWVHDMTGGWLEPMCVCVRCFPLCAVMCCAVPLCLSFWRQIFDIKSPVYHHLTTPSNKPNQAKTSPTKQVVTACLRAGSDYIDLCGEPEFMDRMLLKYHEEARDKGVRAKEGKREGGRRRGRVCEWSGDINEQPSAQYVSPLSPPQPPPPPLHTPLPKTAAADHLCLLPPPPFTHIHLHTLPHTHSCW
jgi:hypothetical protein